MKEADPFSLAVALVRLTEALGRLALLILMTPIVVVAWVLGAIPPLRGARRAVCAGFARIAQPFE